MLDGRKCSRLARETGMRLSAGGDFLRNHFDRYPSPERRLLGQIDRAHPALTDAAENFVA